MRLRKTKAGMNYCEGSEDVSIGTRSWNWRHFLKEPHWFATQCNLPNEGLLPQDILHTVVSNKMLQECFPKRSTSVGHGFKLSPNRLISSSDVGELVNIVEGSDAVARNRISTPLARGVYADKVLGMSVNWALYAHHKHKHQLQRAWNSGRPSPYGPPLVRVPVRYKRPLRLDLKAEDRFLQKETRSRFKFEARECSTAFESSGFPGEEGAATPCSPYSDVAGRDKAHTVDISRSEAPPDNAKNLKTEGPVGNLINSGEPLLSVLTPDRIQLEISHLVQQQKKLRDDISTLRIILEVVSEKDQMQGPSMEGI
ncbi:hypothetical protein R1sor_008235 [Riccia sorocarpa]|uniref:Uncharacterized protein n=1 Tax=Riccia sorocarpa TaxID=122646 RepID=A0ABD3HV09_9MARC